MLWVVYILLDICLHDKAKNGRINSCFPYTYTFIAVNLFFVYTF